MSNQPEIMTPFKLILFPAQKGAFVYTYTMFQVAIDLPARAKTSVSILLWKRNTR